MEISAEETRIMQFTFRTTMLRCADIIDKISQSDLLDAQAALLRDGASLETVAKCDRAAVASAYFRTLAQQNAEKEPR